MPMHPNSMSSRWTRICAARPLALPDEGKEQVHDLLRSRRERAVGRLLRRPEADHLVHMPRDRIVVDAEPARRTSVSSVSTPSHLIVPSSGA